MRLTSAKFCCECEEVFEGTVCPKCGRSLCSVRLSDWVIALHVHRPMSNAEAVAS